MQKKVCLIVGLLALLPVLFVIVLWPEGHSRMPRAGAAHVDSSFSAPYNLSHNDEGYSGQKPRLVHAPDDYLHVAWMDGVLNKLNGPAYIKGRDTTWPDWEWAGPHNNPGYTNPAIALDSQGTVHLVWAGGGGTPYDIYYATKLVGGSWSAPENLSNEGYNTVQASIVIDSQDRVWVAWQTSLADTDTEVYARSKPAGGAWGSVMQVSGGPGKEDQNPSLAIGVNDVPHIVWRSTTPGNWDIVYSKYEGGSWAAPLNISATARGSHFPRIAADRGGNLFVVWEEEVSSGDVFQTYFRRWDGASWQAAKGISEPVKALYPSISSDGCSLYAVWTDYRNASTDTYFNHSFDCGSTWLGDENVSANGTSSFFPDVAAQAGGIAHIVWQDMAPGRWDIFYSKATTGAPPPTTATPMPITPTPLTPTPDPRPSGWVDIAAQQPPDNTQYTRLLTVKLNMFATSPVGNPLLMRYANYDDFHDNPDYVTFASQVPSWTLLGPAQSCASKSVFVQFRDSVAGYESPVYTDYILFDDYVAASMQLNNGRPYTNRTMVMVNSGDEPAGCSGLAQMEISENGITYTISLPYYATFYYFLSPVGQPLRTVYVRYADQSGNLGVFSDSITLDTISPTGTMPTLPASTTHLVVPVTGLQGYDTPSGVANVWLANRPAGPWMVMTYYDPPHTYDWDLAYGGPPILAPEDHYVYVRYEDASGYPPFPGNLSPIYSGTISISGISSVYLPIVARRVSRPGVVAGPGESAAVGLILVTEPQRAGPGQDVLIWLAARREQSTLLEGHLRMMLPEGLRVVRAWSAYGQLLFVGDREVISQERTWDRQVPWILVQARVEEGTAGALQVQGAMTWDQGTVTAPPAQIESR